jgi:uncharacterized membrane protein YGL010W
MALPNWPQLADEFADEHQNVWNQACHFISIPLISLALIRWTQVVPPAHVFPWIALLLPIYYLWSFRVGVAMTVAMIILSAFSYYFVTFGNAVILFVIGVFFELLGHQAFEKNNPAVTKNLLHFFVGPAWVLQKFVKKTIGVDLWPQQKQTI